MAKKVLHLPVEIAGQIGLQVKALRGCGWCAESLFQNHDFKYSHEPTYTFGRTNRWRMLFARLLLAWRTLARFDVYHYHYGQSLLTERLFYADARLNSMLGAKVVVEFWGSDVRLPSLERARNPYYPNMPEENDAKARACMAHWSALSCGHVIVADHSFFSFICEYFSDVHVVRQAIDCRAYQPVYPGLEAAVVRVVHIPSHAGYKGTVYVRAAIDALKARGLPLEYIEVSGVSHDEAMRLCATADIVVDQLVLGSHGVFALEAMALGKPVLCYIMPDMEGTYPDGFPIINANPDTVTEVLAGLIASGRENLHQIGRRSREYVQRVHDISVIGPALADVYATLPGRNHAG